MSPAPEGPHAGRIARVREAMANLDIGALYLTNLTNVQWISGFTGSTAVVLLTQDRAVFATDSRYTEQAASECPALEQFQLRGTAGEITGLIEQTGASRLGYEAGHMTCTGLASLRKNAPEAIELAATERVVEALRLIKDPDEVERIEAACGVVDRAFAHIQPYIRPGVSERDVMLELEWHMRREGGAEVGFDTIVASGPRSALPHGRASTRVMQAGDLVTLDFGARLDQYCSDITRTVVIGPPDDEQVRIYDTVVTAMNLAIQAIRPGLTGPEVDTVARDHIAAAGHGERFGHGLGHSLGMEVHDGPGLSQRSEVTLAPGMVMTVEPGIYIPGWGGVRVEQDVVVTPEGCRVLTHSPIELIAL